MSVFQQQPKKKSVQELLAELTSEFAKGPKQPREKKPEEKTHKDLNKEFHQRISGSNTSTAQQAYANAKARSWRDVPGFEATRRVTNIQHEHCRNCLGTVSYVGNEFTEFYSERLRSRIQSPELVLVDSLGFPLRRELEEWHHEVDECAKCLRLSRFTEDLVAAAFINGEDRPLQLPLFSKQIVKAESTE